MKNVLLPLKLLSVSLVSFLSFQSDVFAYYTNEEVVEEFIKIQNAGSEKTVNAEFKNPYIIPPLGDIIPPHIQWRIRRLPPVITDFRDFRPVVDLRYRDTEVQSQIGGRCSTYGLIAGIENILGQPNIVKLSETHLWSTYKRYSSVSAVESALKNAITEASAWPNNNKKPIAGWQDRPKTELQYLTYIENNIMKAVKALHLGRPVYLGTSVTKSMKNCDPVMNPDSPNTGGGHAVSISGYKIDPQVKGGGYFIIKNSWGKKCGDEGYQYMPFHYCLRGGNSYCIMWDIDGVKTEFPGVSDVTPNLPEFDATKVAVDFSSYRRWYQCSDTVRMKVSGEHNHVRQIKDVSYSTDGKRFSSPVQNSSTNDVISMAFKTKSSSHNITLRMNLRNGEVVEEQYPWNR